MAERSDRQKIGLKRTNHGQMAFFSEGGTMATSGKKLPGFMQKPKMKQEAAVPSAPKQPAFKGGGAINGVASKGKTATKMVKMKKGGRC